MAPKKKATATVGKKRGPKPGKKAATAAAAAAGERKRFNTPMDEENRKLFLNVHLPEIKKLRDRVNSAVGTLRKAYKSAKAEGSFTKADFDTALEMEDAEREARAKARIARQLVIARYMGAGLGAQLDLFTAHAQRMEQAEALIAKARAEIQQERQKAVQDLRSQVADLAVMAAGRIIGESLDAKKHRELIERAIEEAEIRA